MPYRDPKSVRAYRLEHHMCSQCGGIDPRTLAGHTVCQACLSANNARRNERRRELYRMKKASCTVCHARAQEIGEDGLCSGCRAARAAQRAGISYGKYIANQQEKERMRRLWAQQNITPCAYCGKPVKPNPGAGAPKKYCDVHCYNLARYARRREQRAKEKEEQNAKAECISSQAGSDPTGML